MPGTDSHAPQGWVCAEGGVVTSIRKRTSGLVAISVAALIALGGIVLFVVVRAALTAQFDDGLSTRATALKAMTRFDGTKVEIDVAGEVLPRYKPGADAEYFLAWVDGPDGWKELARSQSLRSPAMSEWMGLKRATEPLDYVLPDGRVGRYTMVEFVPSTERDEEHPNAVVGVAPGVRLMVAQSRAALDRVLWTVGMAIGVVGIGLVVVSILATRWAVARGTRPLESLSACVATIGPETLDRRLSRDELPAELVPVADRVNELLARLEEAFAREKRFTSAASHELRTPIAELKILLEVGLTRERTPERWEQTARDGLGVLDRAQRLTEGLLRVSRAEFTRRMESERVTVDLTAVLRQEVARGLAAAGRDATLVVVDATTSLHVRADPTLLGCVIGNLIDNALRHGELDADHPVRCVARSDDGGATLVVANRAPMLTEEDVGHLFEPFWRKDAAREASGGFGLGLVVSRELAASMGASLAAVLDTGQTIRMTLSISGACDAGLP